MGRKGVTYEEVAEVADAMMIAGIEPSTKAVRERLGRGSNSTIGAFLAKWRAKRAAAAAPNIQTNLPPEFARAVTAFINDQVDAVKTAADTALAAERSAGASSEAEVELLRDELEAADGRIAQMEVELGESAGRLKQANDAADALDMKLAAAERRIADAEKIAAVAEARREAAEQRAVEATSRELETRAELKAKILPAHAA